MMKFSIVSLLSIIFLLTGCDKVQKVVSHKVKCNDEIAKELVIKSLSQQISDISAQRVKILIEQENITVDMGKLRAALQELRFQIEDVRTNNSDPNSQKEYCLANFKTQFPALMIEDANAARALYDEKDVDQDAILKDLIFENQSLAKEIEYLVQPTDDGQKVYVMVENADSLAYFLRDVVIDSLIKTARQNAVEQQQYEIQQRIEEQEAAEQEDQQILLAEAQSKNDLTNEKMNLLLNATTQEVRDLISEDQTVWLKKRELECRLNSIGEDYADIAQLNCQTEMTTQRIAVLKYQIANLE